MPTDRPTSISCFARKTTNQLGLALLAKMYNFGYCTSNILYRVIQKKRDSLKIGCNFQNNIFFALIFLCVILIHIMVTVKEINLYIIFF